MKSVTTTTATRSKRMTGDRSSESAAKLTPAQIAALKRVSRNFNSIRFQTGEALRKRGYVKRYTTYVVRAEYAIESGITEQFRCPARAPYARHDWWITDKGALFLQGIGHD